MSRGAGRRASDAHQDASKKLNQGCAGTRRVLVITAEIPSIQDKGPDAFYASMLELGVLTFMILALAVSLLMLRSRHPEAVASRA
jgi:hypothetical protein